MRQSMFKKILYSAHFVTIFESCVVIFDPKCTKKTKMYVFHLEFENMHVIFAVWYSITFLNGILFSWCIHNSIFTLQCCFLKILYKFTFFIFSVHVLQFWMEFRSRGGNTRNYVHFTLEHTWIVFESLYDFLYLRHGFHEHIICITYVVRPVL